MGAQQACSYDLDDIYSPIEIIDAINQKRLRGLVLQAEDRLMLICYQIEDNGALLTCGYRTGKPTNFLSDCRLLWERLNAELREWGVQTVSLYVGVSNPEIVRIHTLLKRLGFEVDMLRSTRRL